MSDSDTESHQRLTCKEVSVLLSQAQDRALGLVERVRLEAHLRICERCENFRRQLEFLRRMIRRDPSLRDEDE